MGAAESGSGRGVHGRVRRPEPVDCRAADGNEDGAVTGARLMAALIASVAAAVTLNAHGRIVIVMQLAPERPVYDQDCRVTVRFMSTAGDAVRVTSEHVALVATMSAHAM